MGNQQMEWFDGKFDFCCGSCGVTIMRSFRQLLLLLSLLASCLPADVAVAREPAADTGVLDVTLPAGATISLNGTGSGDRRHFEMGPLEAGRLYPSSSWLASERGEKHSAAS